MDLISIFKLASLNASLPTLSAFSPWGVAPRQKSEELNLSMPKCDWHVYCLPEHIRRTAMLGALVFAGMALSACRPAAAPMQSESRPTVDVVEATSGMDAQAISAIGVIERRRQITLSFQTGGVIRALNAEAGDFVVAGQVLAGLDPSQLEARQAQTRAELDVLRRALERDQRLFASGFVSVQRLEDRRSALSTAEAAYKAAAFDRRGASLVSPASGYLLSRDAQVGEVVQSGQSIVRLADAGSPWVARANVSDRDIGRLRVGDKATVRREMGAGTPIVGSVTRVGRQADSHSGAIQVEIELPAGMDLRSGQVVNVDLLSSKQSSALPHTLRIPALALAEVRGTQASVLVFLPAKGRVKKASVQFVGFDGDDALVEGLPSGAKVVTGGGRALSDGDAVQISTLPPPSFPRPPL